MKRGLLVITIIILLLALPKGSTTQARKVQIVTTINVLAYVANFIGGEFVEVKSIVTGLENPHTYSLRPDDKRLLEKAEIYIEIGEPLEGFRDSLIAGIDLSRKVVITCLKLPGIIMTSTKNPHIWLNPRNMLIIARAIAKALIKLDPGNADYYMTRYKAFEEKIRELEAYIAFRTQEIDTREVILAAPAPEPLLDYMGIKVLDIIIKTPGQQPKPADILRIEELMMKEGVNVIVKVSVIRVPIVDRIIRDTGAIAIEFIPLLLPSLGLSSYFDLMRYNVDIIVDALQFSSSVSIRKKEVTLSRLTYILMLAGLVVETSLIICLGVLLVHERRKHV